MACEPWATLNHRRTCSGLCKMSFRNGQRNGENGPRARCDVMEKLFANPGQQCTIDSPAAELRKMSFRDSQPICNKTSSGCNLVRTQPCNAECSIVDPSEKPCGLRVAGMSMQAHRCYMRAPRSSRHDTCHRREPLPCSEAVAPRIAEWQERTDHLRHVWPPP